jgi:lipopolysaccharide/colanic/teichoic acid biosynthesis glycosyltransferase
MKVFVWVGLVLLGVIIEAELIAWCRPLQRWLIRRVAAPLPEPDRDRCTEEWYRELEELPDAPITRLVWILPLLFRRASIARAHGVPRAVVGFSGALKRLIDVVCSVVALAIIAPVLIAIGVAIKLEDGGPPLLRQTRIGLNSKPFTIFKFRTITDRTFIVADGETDVVYELKVRHQLTRLGRFLRASSLQELPMLFNVLTGSMSLVGPRPVFRGEARHLPTDRVIVRPGLTGLWQMEGQPGEDHRRLDREYLKRWSLWLDIKILIKTVMAVLRRRG